MWPFSGTLATSLILRSLRMLQVLRGLNWFCICLKRPKGLLDDDSEQKSLGGLCFGDCRPVHVPLPVTEETSVEVSRQMRQFDIASKDFGVFLLHDNNNKNNNNGL